MGTIALVRLIVGRREKAKTEQFDKCKNYVMPFPKFSARAEMYHSVFTVALC